MVCNENIDVEYLYFKDIESTQTYAIEYGNDLLKSPGQWIVISADQQTHGVGLHGDKWVSDSPGNIYASFIFYFPKNRCSLFFFSPIVAALSITKTLKTYGLDSQIKWVNDVVLNKKKISGVLCEWIPSDHPDYFITVLGIGLNVNMSLQETEQIDQPATSMFIKSGFINNKNQVLEKLAMNLCNDMEILKSSGFESFLEPIESKIIDVKSFRKNLPLLMKEKEELTEFLIEKKGAVEN